MAANQGRPINAGGWYHNDFLPWIQNQDLRKSFGYGICIGLFKAFLGNYEQPWSVYIFQDLLLFMIFAFSTLF